MIMPFSQFVFAKLLVYSQIRCEEISERKFPKISEKIFEIFLISSIL